MKIKKYTIYQEILDNMTMKIAHFNVNKTYDECSELLTKILEGCFLVEEEKTVLTCKGCNGVGGCGVGGEGKYTCVRCQIEHVELGEKVLARASLNLPDHTCGLQIENLEEDY